jgi:hypothetical protein
LAHQPVQPLPREDAAAYFARFPGGGGVMGGTVVDGGGAGSGAGSSAAIGLTGETISAHVPSSDNAGGNGEVIISAAG